MALAATNDLGAARRRFRLPTNCSGRRGPYLNAFAAEMAWREDNRRVSNGEQSLIVVNATLAHPVSRQWKGYWQR